MNYSSLITNSLQLKCTMKSGFDVVEYEYSAVGITMGGRV